MRFKIRSRNDNPTDIDDSAIAPQGGFLDGYVGLPTYKRNDLHATISDPSYVRLTISHVIGTIVDECYLARRILFESARLQRPFYSTGPVKLAENEATVDKKLIELDASIRQGNKLIVERLAWEDKKDGSGFTLIQSEDQKIVLEGERFKKALRTAKQSLLELEKAFNDDILDELKNGMQRKRTVDRRRIVKRVEDMMKEFSTIYNDLDIVYREEIDAVKTSQAQKHDVGERGDI